MANFKARARALDLLGRQQIAGIPTAINELFKNAHDAYADNVDIDYFRRDKILVLRDNGLGMTRKDFETRWLTLGTESKFSNRKIPAPPVDPDKKKRPIMGEKGIGRLAIASIGSQVLILTKAKREKEHHKIVAVLINWSLFELPGLNLEDVVVPIREFDSLPTKEDIIDMKKELIDALENLVERDDVTDSDARKILSSIQNYTVSPADLDLILPGDFSLDDNYGTHFYIYPVDDTLNNDIDGESGDTDATKIEKMLVGFTNTMTPAHPKPLIDVAFRDYRGEDFSYYDILDKEEFFTPEEFEIADHHFQGTFDEFGQFSGTVKIYNEKSFDHKINWNGNNYRETDCGPFSINFAYLQGTLRQSILDPENHALLKAKTDKFGGIYVYRDNIRILPYGDSDYDFLDVEKNRTKSAGYYFFSYRRMLGVVDITKKENFNLREKAGREGFIENKAYRQLQEILKNFFLQLAADFFREGSGAGPKSEFWVSKRAERMSFYKALERRDKQSKVRKERFQQSLSTFFDKVNNNTVQIEVHSILENIEKKFGSVAYLDDPDEASQKLIDYELEARKTIEDYKNSLKVSQPRGFTISKDTRRDYDAYLEELERLESIVFQPTVSNVEQQVDNYTTHLSIEISKRKRLEQAVNFISEEAKKAASGKEKETKQAVSEITSKVKDLTNELMIDLDNQIRDVKDRFKKLSIEGQNDFDLVEERKQMESSIVTGKERVTNTLERVIKQLQSIYWERDSEGENYITSDQIADAMSEELEELRERIQADIELSQLGLAVGVIHHEFNSTVKSIRRSLKDLKAWSDVNSKLDTVYNNIKINFEHLDGYLNLFTPLNRRLNRRREDIPLVDVKTFLIDLFKTRLDRHQIKFIHTKGFTTKKIYGFRSTFYPVFVNVIDNAIHWLNKEGISDKVIILHADDNGVYISNNGPIISANDREKIFDLGFTRKRNGRGMGLHISREVLNAEGYSLTVDTPRKNSTVTFKIAKVSID